MAIRINNNYLKLKDSYLFANIANKLSIFQENNPKVKIIKLGIGDVTRPLPPACLEAFKKAVFEMGFENSFRGYGPAQGLDFLRNTISENDYKKRGINILPDEIFISDGSKCDTGNIQELFDTDIKVAIPDPVYPVYLDTNVMAGRTGDFLKGRYNKIIYLDSTEENNFIPNIPSEKVDLIYLCFPNNPTGTAISKIELKKWIDFAKDSKALILYDAAYEAFVSDTNMVRSIYEIKGAKEVAIEFRSFSKNAGFTGVRCAYTVVPKRCLVYSHDKKTYSVNKIWYRRQTTKFNGVSYPVQRAAEAIYTSEGQSEIKDLVNYYMTNARLIRNVFKQIGVNYAGGKNSPYVWIKTNIDSWSFFDILLKSCGVVCTPGSGFGKSGNGYVRISSFNTQDKVEEALNRAKHIFYDYC